jgi:hypothetical protein
LEVKVHVRVNDVAKVVLSIARPECLSTQIQVSIPLAKQISVPRVMLYCAGNWQKSQTLLSNAGLSTFSHFLQTRAKQVSL